MRQVWKKNIFVETLFPLCRNLLSREHNTSVGILPPLRGCLFPGTEINHPEKRIRESLMDKADMLETFLKDFL